MNSTLLTSDSFTGPLSGILSAFTWAIGVSVYTKLTREYPAYVVNFCRALTAFLVFLCLIFWSGWLPGLAAFSGVSAAHVAWLSLSIFCSYALGDALFLMSCQRLGVPAALAIASSYPLWAAVAGWIFKGETLTVGQMLGLLLVVLGVVTVILSKKGEAAGEGQAPRDADLTRGILLALLVSILWAFNSFSVSKGGAGLDARVSNAIRMGIALVLAPIVGFFFVKRVRSPVLPLKVYARSFGIFFVEGFGGAWLYMYSLTHTTLAIASALTSMAPALSVPVAVATGSEAFSALRLGGIALVITGTVFLVRA